MPAVYGSATVANATSKGNTLGAQDMIGTTTALRAQSLSMQNGHIGARIDQVVTPAAAAALIAANDTPAIGNVAGNLLWKVASGTWVPAP